jgi:hypothetical protein
MPRATMPYAIKRERERREMGKQGRIKEDTG